MKASLKIANKPHLEDVHGKFHVSALFPLYPTQVTDRQTENISFIHIDTSICIQF